MTTATKPRRALLLQSRLNPYFWNRAHRVMPSEQPWRILTPGHYWMPYLYEPLCEWDKEAGVGYRQVWSKCSQVGCTEAAIGLSLWFLNECGEGAMYGLPTEDAIKSFVQVRVNPSIRNSPYIANGVRDTDNTDVKLAWKQAWYFRGAISRSKLREIPVGLLVRDEYGEMDEEGRELMPARLEASRYKWELDLGNPRYPESGIDLEYKGGDQSVWKIKCACGVDEEPRWPESIQKVDSVWKLVCPECGQPIEKFEGRWVATNPGAPYRSFRMSQLISPTVEPWEIVRKWEAAQGNETRLQEFWNSGLGLAYAPQGSRLDDEILRALPRRGEMVLGSTKPTSLGADINPSAGNTVIIRSTTGDILWAGVLSWDEMDRAMVAYAVNKAAVDVAPETTKAKEFAKRHPGKVELIRYNPSMGATGESRKEEDGVVIRTVPRTEAIDNAFQRIIGGEIGVPSNLPSEVLAHFKAMTRQIVKTGREEYAAWVESGPDHFAHAFVYSELVLDNRPIWEQVGVYV